MIKKTLATVAVAASVVGATGLAAAPAMAIGGDDESGNAATVNGNGSKKVYGNTTTGGYMSPNVALVSGSLNDVCVPIDDISSAVPIVAIPDDILSGQPDQECAENSTQVKGDDPLSRLLSDISLLSENGVSRR
ncbi:rodlin [Streptomyces sp. NBC_01803]|uniref:rodlin n=1 Tax=Streptomyces sp. NBC_01803 TaxID=2975946 RepID=UPI002DDB8EBB|nr:rodlin [Streptomyces sp. NBC_01803]WSA44593.1 rodlin [Streptomyces sp. NBC_01803]